MSTRMTTSKLYQLFALCADLYKEKLAESSKPVLDFAWAANEETGELVVYSAFGVKSRQLAERLGIPWKSLPEQKGEQ